MTSLFSRQEYRLPRTKRRGGLLRLSSYTRSSVDPKLPTSLESAHCPGFLESEQSRYIPRASQCGVLSAQAKAARAAQNGCGLGYSDPAKVRIVLYCDAVMSDREPAPLSPILIRLVRCIALRLNQRPRKTLGFETPADRLLPSP